MNPALRVFPSVDTPRAPESPASVVVTGFGDELLTVNDAARLLHVTVSWVNIYTHVIDASHRAAIEQLERQLFPTVPKSAAADTPSDSLSVTKRAG